MFTARRLAHLRVKAARLELVLQRTASAMGITSLTTAAAFLSCAMSSIPPLRCFGIFLAFVILANYVLVITWYPAVRASGPQRLAPHDAARRMRARRLA